MARVTVLGLGAMGSRMAARLLAAGHEVVVWNRTPGRDVALVAAGASAASTPRAAVAGAGVVVAMVRDDAASEAVWLGAADGALGGMDPGAVAVESSTVTAAWARELAARFEAAGVAFLDAPVAGSRPQAEAGHLIHLVGGDAGILAQVGPVLGAMGATVHHAGRAGDGAALKLAVNALFAVQVAAAAELLGVLRRAGLNPAAAAGIIGATPVCSPAVKGALASMVSGAYAPQFPADLASKDLGYALALGTDAGGAMPITRAAASVFAEAVRQGFGPDNLTGVARLYG